MPLNDQGDHGRRSCNAATDPGGFHLCPRTWILKSNARLIGFDEAAAFLQPNIPTGQVLKPTHRRSYFGPSCGTSTSAGSASGLVMKHAEDGGDADGREMTRKRWLEQAAAAAATAVTVAGGALASSTLASSSAAAASAGGLPASGFFVQHAVFKVTDLDAEVRFFTQGLGMKVVRQRQVGEARNVFVAYGEESLAVKDGGYCSLELVYDPKAPPTYGSGGPFQYLGITLPSTLAMVAYNADSAGGTVVPHWFAQTNYVEVASPGGTTVRVHKGSRRDPFAVVAFGTMNDEKARAYFHNVLGMKEQTAVLLKLLGPLAGDAIRLLGYDPDGVSVALNPVTSKIPSGGTFDKLAVLTKDTKALAARVSESGGAKTTGGDVLFAGEVPGIGTKVANTVDFEGRGVVFVDYEDFEKEMAPSSK